MGLDIGTDTIVTIIVDDFYDEDPEMRGRISSLFSTAKGRLPMETSDGDLPHNTILGYFPVQRQWAYKLVCQLRRSDERGRQRHLGDGQRGGTRELKQVSRHLGLVPTGVSSTPWHTAMVWLVGNRGNIPIKSNSEKI